MIIALESASSDPSLALAERTGTPLGVDGWVGERRQASELMPHLLVLLARTGRELRDATAVAVGIGPGSFTGLRVSMSLAKGIALGLGIPIVGVPSLEAWLRSAPEAAAAVVRGGAQESFVLARGEREPLLVANGDLASTLTEAVVVAPSELLASFALRGSSPREAAAAVAAIAVDRLAEMPDGDDLVLLEPRYVRRPYALADATPEVSAWP